MKGVKRARYDEEDSTVKANTLDGRPKIVMDLAQKVKIVSYDNIFSPFELRVHLWLEINVSRKLSNQLILCLGSEGEDLGLHWLSCPHVEAILQQR